MYTQKSDQKYNGPYQININGNVSVQYGSISAHLKIKIIILYHELEQIYDIRNINLNE